MDPKQTENAVSRVLLGSLEELEEEEFKKFKQCLADYPLREGISKIPSEDLEKAGRTNTADLMVNHYQDQYALEITEDVLQKIPRMDVFRKSQNASKTYRRKKYEARVEKVFSALNDKHSCASEHGTSGDGYSDLLMVRSSHYREYEERLEEKSCHYREYEERLEERSGRYSEYEELLMARTIHYNTSHDHRELGYHAERTPRLIAQEAALSYTSIAALFQPRWDGDTPTTIVLVGEAGIGKTVTARKIMRDWASGDHFSARFQYVFYIHCREHYQTWTEQTVEELIVHCCGGEQLIRMADIEHPSKLLFVIDGFDELKITQDFLTQDPATDKTLVGLIGRKCLSGAFILITTRPAALEPLHQCLHHITASETRFTEILGFSESARREYFTTFFETETQGADAFNIVKVNSNLFRMCRVPMVCWIVCTAIKQQLELKEDLASLRTATSVYMLFVSSLLKQKTRNAGMQPSVRINLKRLCTLAKDGIYQQKTLFDEDDLAKYGADLPMIQSLFTKNLIIQNVNENCNVCSFSHLNVEEFFAALFYVLEESEATSEDRTDPQRDVIHLLEHSRQREQKHLLQTVQFLFGLINKDRLSLMESTLQWRISPDIKPLLQTWMRNKIHDKVRDQQVDLLQCLYETEDEEFVTSATQHLQDIELNGKVNSIDSRTLAFCLKNSPTVQGIYLSNLEMMKEDVQVLTRGLAKCARLTLDHCSLTSSSCADLTTVLRTKSCLRELNLSGNNLKDSGVKELCEGLKHPDCRIESLRLDHCSLTSSSCAALTTVLRTKSCLKELGLSGNTLKDSGVKQLCEGLKHPGCSIERLRLDHCSLTCLCCAALTTVLRTKSCLRELGLSGNGLKDSGVKKLCAGLKHSDCSIERLNLQNNDITDDSTEALCLALNSKRSLWHLNLLGNNFTGRSAASFHVLKETIPELELKDLATFLPLAGETYVGSEKSYYYRSSLLSPGILLCAKTGLCFEVAKGGVITYDLLPWDHRLIDFRNQSWRVAGPFFEIKAEPGVVEVVYLPHFVYLKDGDVDTSRLKVAHFAANGEMTLENPSEVQPFHVVLRNPKFSKLGVVWIITQPFWKLFRIFTQPIWQQLPIQACALLYQKPSSACITLHLYVIPNEPLLIKELERWALCKLLLIEKPSRTKRLYYDCSYTVDSEPSTDINPKELEFDYMSPGQKLLSAEIYMDVLPEEGVVIRLMEHQGSVSLWDAKVRPVDIDFGVKASLMAPETSFMKNKLVLQKRLGLIRPILDILQQNKVIVDIESEEILQEKTPYLQNTRLLGMVEKKGALAQQQLLEALRETDPFLLKYLEDSH